MYADEEKLKHMWPVTPSPAAATTPAVATVATRKKQTRSAEAIAALGAKQRRSLKHRERKKELMQFLQDGIQSRSSGTTSPTLTQLQQRALLRESLLSSGGTIDRSTDTWRCDLCNTVITGDRYRCAHANCFTGRNGILMIFFMLTRQRNCSY